MIRYPSYVGSRYLIPHNSVVNIDPIWGIVILVVFAVFTTYIALRVRYEIRNEKRVRPDRKFRSFPIESKEEDLKSKK